MAAPKAHGEDDGLQPSIRHAKEAEHTIYIFKHHPVLQVVTRDGESVDVSKFPHFGPGASVLLRPLHDNDEYNNDTSKWGEDIGFGAEVPLAGQH
jgi:hypothetical protein